MDSELTKHLMDIKTSIGKMESNVTNIKENLDYHIARDEAKFKDLYTRHEAHAQFQNRVKGTAKGAGLLAACAAGVLTFWQQLVEAFTR